MKLSPGAYELPNDCKAFVRGGVVYVSKKHIVEKCDRCRDCKHFGYGRNAYNQEVHTLVCFKRPKTNKSYLGKPAGKQVRFYAVIPSARACELFEPKNQES